MNYEHIKKLKCPQLVVKSIEIDDVKVKWGGQIEPDNDLFLVNHSREQLETGIVYFPSFTDEEMTGIPFSNYEKDGPVQYQTHCNYSDHFVEYQKCHLVKVVQRFGVKVLKTTEEKFCTKIKKESTAFHFMYSFDEKRWIYLKDPEEIFKAEKDKIDFFCNSQAYRNMHMHYFADRKFVNRMIQSSDFLDTQTYREKLNNINKLITSSKTFLEMKNYLGEIPDYTYEKMTDSIIELSQSKDKLEKRTSNLKLMNSLKKTNDTDNENALIIKYADILTDTKKTYFTPGYWISNGEIYPNIGEFYNLSQVSETNRNEETKFRLKKQILRDNPGKTFVPL